MAEQGYHGAYSAESISNWGLRCLPQFLPFTLRLCAQPGMPAAEIRLELAIQHLCPHLQKVVRPKLTPPHLLLLDHALAHDLINARLREGRGDRLAVPVPVAAVRNVRPVHGDVALELSQGLQGLPTAVSRLPLSP